MTEPRTVTIRTEDRGDVTIPEPGWCVGHEGQRPELFSDTLHQGPDVELAFRGYLVGTAGLVQSPYALEVTHLPEASVSLLGQTLDPAGLDEWAAVLVEHAARLRHLARELAALLGGDR